MEKTITVKGVGSVSTKPDYIVLTMCVRSKDKDYEKALSGADGKVERITEAVVSCGHKSSDLKTSSFNVHSEYRSEMSANGVYKNVFDGYACEYRLKLGFSLDLRLLSETISSISETEAEPEIQIGFTVKNPDRIKKALLVSATKSAKEKAKILCEASGNKLGELLSISYDRNDINVRSNTAFGMCNEAMPMMKRASLADMVPEDIESSDFVTFVWEIL